MSGNPGAPWLDDDHLEVLLRILRSRPRTVTELRALFGSDGIDPEASLVALRDAGFLEVDSDDIVPLAPEVALARITESAIAQQHDALDAMGGLVARLPDLAKAWEIGAAPDDYGLRSEVIEGGERALQRWFANNRDRPPVAPGLACGDLSIIHEQYLPNLDDIRTMVTAGQYIPRLLVPADALVDQSDRDALTAITTLGGEIRVATSVPSWLYVDSGVLAAVPLKWGARSPDSFVSLYDPAVIEPVSWIFETWWGAATPWPLSDGEGWEQVLRLLARGRSDEQIAAILDISVRTVRRRIADAMEREAVGSRFELGMRWALRTASD